MKRRTKISTAFVLAASLAAGGFALHNSRSNDESTFVPKAFAELEYLHKFLMSTTPQSQIDIAKRGHELIDTYTDHSQGDKEEMKALLVLMLGEPYLFDDTSRFKSEFNEDVNTLVKDYVSGETHNPRVLQVAVARNIAQVEKETIKFKDPEYMKKVRDSLIPSEEVARLEQEFMNSRKEPDFQAVPAPLLELEAKVVAEMFATIKAVQAAPAPNSAPGLSPQ